MVGNDCTFGCDIIFSVLYTVQFIYRYLIEINHIADDVIGRFLFLEQESTRRNPML